MVAGDQSALSTVNESEGEWKETRSESDRDRYNHRNNRNGMRGRGGGGGRVRGSRRPGFHRPANRIPSDPEYPDFSPDYLQGNVSYFTNIHSFLSSAC